MLAMYHQTAWSSSTFFWFLERTCSDLLSRIEQLRNPLTSLYHEVYSCVYPDRIPWPKCLISSCSKTDAQRGSQLLVVWGILLLRRPTINGCPKFLLILNVNVYINPLNNLIMTLFKIWRNGAALSLQCSERETNMIP